MPPDRKSRQSQEISRAIRFPWVCFSAFSVFRRATERCCGLWSETDWLNAITAWSSLAKWDAVWYCVMPFCLKWCGKIQHGIVWCCVWYDTCYAHAVTSSLFIDLALCYTNCVNSLATLVSQSFTRLFFAVNSNWKVIPVNNSFTGLIYGSLKDSAVFEVWLAGKRFLLQKYHAAEKNHMPHSRKESAYTNFQSALSAQWVRVIGLNAKPRVRQSCTAHYINKRLCTMFLWL